MEPSLALLIACCRSGFDDPVAAPGPGAALASADGDRLTTLARRHRVEGLVWRAMRRQSMLVPGTQPLGHDARAIALEGLQMAAETGRIHRAFAQAGLPHLFLKGQALGQLAWGDPSLKRQIDIDLLVTPDGIGKSAALLGALGYVQQIPEPSVDPVDWHRRRKESLWRSDDGLLVDLHSRVADNPALLPLVTALVPVDQVEIAGGITVPTLRRALLLPYLAVHGGSSAWFRLKWLADFAAVVHRTDAATIDRLAERAEGLGAGRALAAALVLSHRLFATHVPEGLWFDRGARTIVDLSLGALSDPIEPTMRRFGTIPIHRAQLLLAPGPGYLVNEALRQIGALLIR